MSRRNRRANGASAAGMPSIFGIMVVRNAVDLLRINLLHHLDSACERILVIDNGSTDNSTTVLTRLARRLPIEWTIDSGPYNQSEMFTALAAEARSKGAQWVLPLDADEFWLSARTTREVIASADAMGLGALVIPRVEFVQARDQRIARPSGVLRATKRVAAPVLDPEGPAAVLRGERSMFELLPPNKLALRLTAKLEIDTGAHFARGLEGPIGGTSELEILHLPFRALSIASSRVEHGLRAAAADPMADTSFQSRRWAQAHEVDELDELWNAHSYADSSLDVAGRRVELIDDPRLADALRPRLRRLERWRVR